MTSSDQRRLAREERRTITVMGVRPVLTGRAGARRIEMTLSSGRVNAPIIAVPIATRQAVELIEQLSRSLLVATTGTSDVVSDETDG